MGRIRVQNTSYAVMRIYVDRDVNLYKLFVSIARTSDNTEVFLSLIFVLRILICFLYTVRSLEMKVRVLSILYNIVPTLFFIRKIKCLSWIPTNTKWLCEHTDWWGYFVRDFFLDFSFVRTFKKDLNYST